tara:strand:+ start:5332 stop:5568 length:237 start_codon:yes stop_codon:yes gene_type:complete
LERKSGIIVIIIEEITIKYTKVSEEMEYINAKEKANPTILVKPRHFFEECVNERFLCETYQKNIANVRYNKPEIKESS